MKKLEKEKKKAEQKASRVCLMLPIIDWKFLQAAKREETTSSSNNAAEDVSVGLYGTLPLIQSAERSGRVFTSVGDLNETKENQTVLIRGRVHASRGKGW